MLARLLIVVFLAGPCLVGCGDKPTNAPTAPPPTNVTKDAKGKELPKGLVAPESPF